MTTTSAPPLTHPPPIAVGPDHWRIVQAILEKHARQYDVWAFGSRARGAHKPFSDLDLAIMTDEPLPLAVRAALADDFSESDLPWKVDVIDWATTSASFRRIIEGHRVVVQTAQPAPAGQGDDRG